MNDINNSCTEFCINERSYKLSTYVYILGKNHKTGSNGLIESKILNSFHWLDMAIKFSYYFINSDFINSLTK